MGSSPAAGAIDFFSENAMTKRNAPVVVGIGELLWDMLPGGKRAGGAPVNFVYHAAQNGAEGYAISAVGNDGFGREIIAELDKKNILHIVERSDYPTGYVDVTLENGIPSYTIVENVAWDHIPFTVRAQNVLHRADAVCFGTLALRHKESRQNILKLIDESNPAALKFFDINLRRRYYSRELVEELLQKSSVFKINDEEILTVRSLFGLDGNDEEVCRLLLKKYNLRYLIFTAGEKYSIIYTANETSYLETPQVKVTDTVGAGDAFSGTFICGILKGKSLREAHQNAADVAAYVCTQHGAWPDYSPELKIKIS